MPPLKTQEQFIKQAKERHGETYDYSKAVYTGDARLVTIICPEHGEFQQTANCHLKFGCTPCGYNRNANRQAGSNISSSAVKAGDVFGRFTIVEPNVKSNQWRQRKSLVRCSCGYETTIQTLHLTSGKVAQCKNCNVDDHIIKPNIGDRYGSWTVISDQIIKKYHSSFHVRCDCGFEAYKSHAALRAGKTKTCQSCAKSKLYKGIEELSGSYIASLKAGSASRNLQWDVTIEELWDLFNKQKQRCALSGELLTLHPQRKNQTASLDRIDSTKGYVKGNIQWIHKVLNRMKMALPDEELILWCQKISLYQKSK